MTHKEYKTPEELLEAIYQGCNLANKNKRNKKAQAANFAENTKFGDVDLEQEFKLKDDCTGMLGYSILTHAIRTHNKFAIKRLLAVNPELANHYRKGEFHPLFLAAQLGSKDIVNILIKYGANPYLRVYKPIDPRTDALMMEVIGKHTTTDDVYQTIVSKSFITKSIKDLIKNIKPQETTLDEHQKVIFSNNSKPRVNEHDTAKQSLFNKK